MKNRLLIVGFVLGVVFASAQEIPLRRAWKLDWKGTQVRTADNCLIALWEDTEAGDTDIWAQKFNPSGVAQWAEPRLIVSEPGVQEILECKPTSDNNFVLLYQQSGYGYQTSLHAQKFTSNGQPLWGEGGVLVRNGQVTACLAPNAIGGAYVIFRSTSQTVSGQNLDSFGNQLWPVGGLVLASHTSIINLDGAVNDGEGGVIINAKKLVNSLSITELTRYSPQGTVIGNNPMLPAGAFPGYEYSITRDAMGDFVLWNVNTPNINGLILRKMDSSGNLLQSAPVIANLDIFTAGYNKPSLQPVSDGGLIFCYEVLTTDNKQMRVLRFDSSYAPLWGPEGVQIAGDPSHSLPWKGLSLAVTDGGGAWLSWINYSDYDWPQELRAQYVTPVGTIPWGMNGTALSTDAVSFRLSLPLAFSDRAMFLWQDQLGPDNAIRRQVLSTGGATFFAFGGEPAVSRLAGIAQWSKVVALQDRYLVLCQDLRDGWYNLYFQLCDTNMNPLLEPNGRPLFSQPADMHITGIRVLSMPDNRVALLYRCESYGATDLPYHLQMIDAQGNTVYPGFGMQIAQTGGDFQFSLCNNDLYIGWLEGDNDHQYLMGQRVSNGQALWGPEGKVLTTLPQSPLITADLVGMRDRYYVLNTLDWNTDTTRILVLRFDPNGDLEPGWPAQGIEAFTANAQIDDYSPSNALLEGDLLLFTHNYPTPPRTQRITQAGTKLWGEDGIQLPQMAMQSIVDAADGPVILYTGQYEPQDLRLQKIDGNGNLLYGVEGHLVAQNLFNCWDANLLKFANGSMACVWTDYSSLPYGYRDVYIRHFDTQGVAIGSSADVLCEAWLEQEDVHAAVIGNSALVAWSDARAGILDSENFVSAIYATRINSSWVQNSDPAVPQLGLPELQQNYPNPFNPETTITFSLPCSGQVDLAIYNQKGQLIRSLSSNQDFPSGEHSLEWDGCDDTSNPVSSGIYLYRLSGMGKTVTRKMVLMK